MKTTWLLEYTAAGLPRVPADTLFLFYPVLEINNCYFSFRLAVTLSLSLRNKGYAQNNLVYPLVHNRTPRQANDDRKFFALTRQQNTLLGRRMLFARESDVAAMRPAATFGTAGYPSAGVHVEESRRLPQEPSQRTSFLAGK